MLHLICSLTQSAYTVLPYSVWAELVTYLRFQILVYFCSIGGLVFVIANIDKSILALVFVLISDFRVANF